MLKKWAAVTLSVSLALSLAACGGQQGASSGSAGSQAGDTQASSGGEVSADEGDVIKIGLISMMTGDNPLNGERMNQGVQMAVDEYNAAGGINGKQIELTIVDDQTLQDMAVTCANKLIGEGVVGIVGPHRSTNALAVEAVVKQAGVAAFTGGTTPQISTLDNDYLFRCRASDSIFAEAAAAYAKELGCKKLGLFFNNDDFGTGAEGVIKQYCADNGMEYVEEGHNTGDKDFTPQVMKMKDAGVDTVIIWTHDAELAIHARQIYELGLDVQVVSSPGVTMQQVIDMCKAEYIEGWYGVTDYVSTSDDPTLVAFKENFEKKYEIEPELYAASYYGGAVALLEGIKAAGTTDRKAVMEAVKGLKDLKVPVGVITCDENNDLVHNINVAQNICVTTAVSSIICSVIGMLIIPLFNISTTMAASIGLKGFSAGVIGGFGYLPGAILGGLFIGVVENLAVVVLPAVYKDIVSFVLLIIFLLVHPSGFLGKKA